jgi:hypothetical protein
VRDPEEEDDEGDGGVEEFAGDLRREEWLE